MRQIATFAACTLLAAAAWAQLPQSVPPAAIPGYRLLQPGLAAAGQPSPEALAQLGQLGFRTVVNLRAPAEGPADEKAVVEGQGLRYVSVPVTPETFSLDAVTAVEAVLADASAAPVLLHCASSNRVGAVWAVLQARRGMPLDQALAEGQAAGMKPSMDGPVRRVLGVAPAAPVAPAPASAPTPQGR